MTPSLHFLFRLFNRIRPNGKSNHIDTGKSDVKYCEFQFHGSNNSFQCRSTFKHAGVRIYGNDNTIIIGKGGELRNLRLWIVGNHCTIRIGDDIIFNGGRAVCGGDHNHLTIGDRCMFAEGIEIWASDTHPVYQEGKVINPSRPIEIQQHVWLGTNVMVMKGAVIGEGAVIGMGSLVRGEIPPRCIAAGHPARLIRTDIDWDKSALQC